MSSDGIKPRKDWRLAALAAALFALAAWLLPAVPALPQRQPQPVQPLQPPGFPAPILPGGPDEQHDRAMEQMQKRLATLRNRERQKEIVQDTDKLLALAAELKNSVAKGSRERASADDIKRMDEIAKLAKNVRDRMKSE
ncbi:MAG TPA: hypothetical protein VGR96_10165 [Acidobacteriaceae bacterium]|nr:hypothetical protein [Acidobacteriaceae bacterium]